MISIETEQQVTWKFETKTMLGRTRNLEGRLPPISWLNNDNWNWQAEPSTSLKRLQVVARPIPFERCLGFYIKNIERTQALLLDHYKAENPYVIDE